MDSVRVGSKVRYKENGDTGVIIDIILGVGPFIVKWDNDDNSTGEAIDGFNGDQLELIEY